MNNKKFWTSIMIIYYAMVFGVVFFLGVASYLVSTMGAISPMDENMTNIMLTVSVSLGFAAYLGTKFYDKIQLKELEKLTELMDKLNWFKKSLLVQAGIMNAVSEFVIVLYLMTANYLMLTPLIITLGVMVFIRPDVYKAAELLHVKRDEILNA